MPEPQCQPYGDQEYRRNAKEDSLNSPIPPVAAFLVLMVQETFRALAGMLKNFFEAVPEWTVPSQLSEVSGERRAADSVRVGMLCG
jgi:hypothetical protein